ncbi:hypothetical protein CMO93_02190 [Candidatus Woesearchaeota archaeon]|nr:hypothetical protein [Candidatus Woesearchaeota archaeon]
MKNFKDFFTTKRLVFIALFALFAFITQRINFSGLVGAENQFFTVFQFFGPIAGAFLGPVVGVIAVFLAEVTDFFIVGKEATLVNLMRLAPMLFATYFFATMNSSQRTRMFKVFVPLAAILLFVLHPVGREAWFFSLYWTIPIIAVLLPKKYSNSIIARSLGATFTAHAVGGALWIWTVPMTAGQWIGLIPVVAYERLMFAAGIGISYVVFNVLFDKVLDKLKIEVPSDILKIDKRFTLKA